MSTSHPNLIGHRIAIVSLDSSLDELKHITHCLHQCEAHLTAVSPAGQLDSGWMAGESLRFKVADAEEFDSLLITISSEGVAVLKDNQDAKKFITDFFATNKPVAVLGEAIALLAEYDLIKGYSVSTVGHLLPKINTAGATLNPEPMTVHKNLFSFEPGLNIDDFAYTFGKLVERVPGIEESS